MAGNRFIMRVCQGISRDELSIYIMYSSAIFAAMFGGSPPLMVIPHTYIQRVPVPSVLSSTALWVMV